MVFRDCAPKVVPVTSPRSSGPVTGGLTTVTEDATSAATSPARRMAYGLLAAYRPAAPLVVANLTRLAFAEIMCKALSKFLGRQVIIAPEGQYVPASPLEAAELFSTHRDRLAPEVQRRIEDSLREARKQAAEADRASLALEREIRGLIVNALADLGEPLSETEIN